MPIAQEIQQVLPDCYLWQAWCATSKVDLTSHAVTCDGHLLLIDPINLSAPALRELEALDANPAAIILTSGNHERAASFFQARYNIPIYADPDAEVDLTVGFSPHPTSLMDLDILSLPGAAPGETALYRQRDGLLIVGDILINLNTYRFTPLPDKYATDPKQMRRSIQSLSALEIKIICFAHGLPITTKAKERLVTLQATLNE